MSTDLTRKSLSRQIFMSVNNINCIINTLRSPVVTCLTAAQETPGSNPIIYTVSQKKNNTDIAHYNFNANQPFW